ncbi:putative PWI domain-containing protein [Medicago truncatula]|uniref:Putative PWI domain-containing protein n=1 Tax=Medicago truncatula TaxID=3880 RepID=A0A396JKM2_MEDTR|nr:putative PWI domain-containing protein [Medicago truncatula]
MANNDNLKTCVSDKLMSLLGYSQPTIVQYIIGLSKQATSPADLVGKLVEFGFSSTDTRAFVEEIFSRVPRRSSGLNQYKKQ